MPSSTTGVPTTARCLQYAALEVIELGFTESLLLVGPLLVVVFLNLKNSQCSLAC